MLPKSVSLWTIKDLSLTCAWNPLHLQKIIINIKYSSSVWCSSGQDRCRALMERPDTCHVPSQTTSGRKKQKQILDIIRYYQKVSVLSQPRSGRGKTKTTSSLSKSSDIIKQVFDKCHVPPQATSDRRKKNNMMIKSVHLGVPLCGKHSRNKFFPTLPFFKFEINRDTKSPLLDLISSDRLCHYWPDPVAGCTPL